MLTSQRSKNELLNHVVRLEETILGWGFRILTSL